MFVPACPKVVDPNTDIMLLPCLQQPKIAALLARHVHPAAWHHIDGAERQQARLTPMAAKGAGHYTHAAWRHADDVLSMQPGDSSGAQCDVYCMLIDHDSDG